MAEVYAVKNGNWTDPTVWNTGSLPLSVDDVFSNNFTVQVNVTGSNARVASVSNRNGTVAVRGGFFNMLNNISLTAGNIFTTDLNSPQTITFNLSSPNTCSLFGNIIGALTPGSSTAVTNANTGTLNFYGTIPNNSGTGGNQIGISNSGTLIIYGSFGSINTGTCVVNSGTLTVYGNVSGTLVTTGGVYGISNTGTCTIFGNVYGSFASGTTVPHGILNSSSGILNVFGNVFGGQNLGSGGSNKSSGISNINSARVNVLGNIFGGNDDNILNTAGMNSGIGNSSSGLVSITGSIMGGRRGGWGLGSIGASSNVIVYGNVMGSIDTDGVYNASTSTITVFGNVSGGGSVAGSNIYGINNVSTGRVFVYGDARGGIGSGCHGVFNNVNNGFVYVRKAVGNGFGTGSTSNNVLFPSFGAANGLFNNAISGMCYVEELESGSRGMFPTAGVVYLSATSNTKAVFRDDAGKQYTLFSSNPTLYIPLSSDVRFRTAYNNNTLTGSLGMPRPNQVNSGVPVDNSTGTAVFDSNSVFQLPVSAIGEQGSMGARIKLVATNNSVQRIINNLNQ